MSTPVKNIEREAQRLFEAYRPQIDMLDRSLLAKVRSITPYDVFCLGKQLESFEVYKDICEADGSAAQLGRIPDIALDVISVAYGSNILPVVASVQNIDEQSGLIYYKTVKAATSRGNVTAGEDLIDPRALTKTPQGYSSNQVLSQEIGKAEAIAANATGSLTGNLTAKPVLPQSVRININGDSTKFGMDNGSGVIMGVGISGTINYETGAVVVNMVGAVAANTAVVASYQTNVEASEDIAQVQSEFATKQVKARIYALKSTIGMLQAYAMQKRFGMVAEDEAAKDLISEINSELGGDLVRVIAANTPNTDTPLKWNRTAPSGVSVFEHRLSIMDALALLDKNIATTAGRGTANIYIAGATACTVLQGLPTFKMISDATQIGPHVFGTLGGRTIVRVVDSNVLASNKIIGVYKGLSPFEACCVYCPYMPLVVTSTLPAGANPLQSQRAAAVWAAVDSMVPQFSSSLEIENAEVLFSSK